MESTTLAYVFKIFSDNWGLIFLTFILLFLYNYYTKTHDHFRDMGVPFMKPTIILGNIGSRVFAKESFHEFNIKLYKHFEGLPYGGYFEGRRPLLMIRDPELLKTIMIKDFDSFTDRSVIITNAPPYIKKMLINLKGKEWKNVRTILTPTFSSGKLRAMENLVQQCGQQITEFLRKRTDQSQEMEMKEFIGRYTLEVIGSCAFGLDCASLKDPNAEFVKVAAKFVDIPLWHRIIFFSVLMFCPRLLPYMPITMMNMSVMKQLAEVVSDSKLYREKLSSEKRQNDFMQLMVDAAQKEILENADNKVMTEDIIQAQAILFLIAGFETSSTLLSFACGVLATHQDLQDKLRHDIHKAAKGGDGDCTYDIVNEIPLLDRVLLETLRLYPPVSRVDRICTKPYTIPGTNLNLKVGDVVTIPIVGIMSDPEFYPDPSKFDPERFTAEEKARRSPEHFLPFGMGPRNCIGLRFAMMSAKFALFYLLRDFKLNTCSKTQDPIKFHKRALLLKSEKGIWVKAEPICNN